MKRLFPWQKIIRMKVLSLLLVSLVLAKQNNSFHSIVQCSKDSPCLDGSCCSKYGFCGDEYSYCSPSLCDHNCWDSSDEYNDDSFGISDKRKTTCTKGRAVALTFSGGPRSLSKELLKTLKEKNAKATFFVLGINVEKHSDMIKKAHEEGHLIATQGWSNVNMSGLEESEIKEGLKKTAKLIHKITGEYPKYVRPPRSEMNPCLEDLLIELGYEIVLSNLDSLDWAVHYRKGDASSVYEIVSGNLKEASHNQEKSWIVEFTDALPQTIESLDKIIQYIHKHHLQIVRIDECLQK